MVFLARLSLKSSLQLRQSQLNDSRQKTDLVAIKPTSLNDGDKALIVFASPATKAAKVQTKTLEVEVVRSPARLAQGLSGRTEIGADGMLFILPQTRVETFWMNDMLFPLDIIWILDGKVVDISVAVPAPSSKSDQPARVWPKSPVSAVLELNSGAAKNLGIEIGSVMTILQPTDD